MLLNRDKLARMMLGGEITSQEDLNGVLRSMIKGVVETAPGAGMTGFEKRILSMYAKGMSIADNQHEAKGIYNHDISPETVSRITDAVIDKAKEWPNRP
ncbi:transposase [Solidesulfovibrio sp.]|uniref:transposase n=1 Tax=Solidesulfovibrio sp. TaxID=2910990 RepID=UPI0026097B51|nr:transposase [Solidesulfovibrio sp.]